MVNQVNLEDNLLSHLASQASAVAAFPFLGQLKAAATARGSCAPCTKTNRQRIQTFNQVKAAVAALDLERRVRFKQLLGAGQLRVRWLDGSTSRESLF